MSGLVNRKNAEKSDELNVTTKLIDSVLCHIPGIVSKNIIVYLCKDIIKSLIRRLM